MCVQFRKAGQATRQRQEEAPTMPHLTPADRPQRENSLRRNFHFRVSWRLSGASSSMPSSFAAFPVIFVILVILHIFHGGNRPHYRRFASRVRITLFLCVLPLRHMAFMSGRLLEACPNQASGSLLPQALRIILSVGKRGEGPGASMGDAPGHFSLSYAFPVLGKKKAPCPPGKGEARGLWGFPSGAGTTPGNPGRRSQRLGCWDRRTSARKRSRC